MAFKIPKATSADDIAVWLTGAKQQLDDYFVQLPASQWDDYVPLQKVNPNIPVSKYQNLESAAKQAGSRKGLQDDALDNYVLEQMSPHLVTLTSEERATEVQLLIDGEKRNYIQDIERQAKRFGYQPQMRRSDGDDSGVDDVPRRSAKAPQGTQPLPTTLVPEGINIPQAIAISKQKEEKGGGKFFDIMKKEFGLGYDKENKRWVDHRALEWDEEAKGYKVKQQFRDAQQQQTPPASPPPGNAMTEAELSALEQNLLASQPQSTPQEVLGTVAPIPTNNGAIAPEVLSEVLASQPQYEGKSSVETAPASGVNPLADGYKSGTSSGIPMTGSNVPPSKPPGGGSMNFEGGNFDAGNNNYGKTFNQYPQGESPEQIPIPGVNEFVEAQAFKQAQDAANTGNYFQNLWDGATRGFQYGVNAGKYEGRTASAAWNRAPESQYAHLRDEGKFGFGVGRVAGDVIGNGSRQVLWNLHPADLIGTHGSKVLGEDASRMAKVVVPFAAVTGLELGSQIYNPFNLAEGGRVAGYQAINPDEDDPRISTSPVSELLIDRGFLGKRGRLLPWEQFRQERTDIPYEQYEKYQDYLRNKDENTLRDMTGGLIKGTLDGINGPELSVMGYSVTPTGALAAGAALLAGRELVRTGRIAGFRK